MEGIADFLDSLIGSVDLVFYAMAIGGLFWAMVILQPWNADRKLINDNLLQATITLIYKGALALAIAQLFTIILKIWLMTAILEKWPFPEFATTSQFIAGMIRFFLSLILARYCYQQNLTLTIIGKPQSFTQFHWLFPVHGWFMARVDLKILHY